MSKTVLCVDVTGKKHERGVDELEWRPSAYGIVIKDDKILLSKQFGDKYDLPGGGVDIDESIEGAVIREIKEETDIDAKNPKFLGFEESYFCDEHAQKGESYHSLMFYYHCEFVGGELSTEGFDEWEQQYAEMAEWIPLEKLNEIKVASSIDYRQFVKKALEQEK